MRKSEIDSLLLVNWYFTTCKLDRPSCPKTELVRKYLLNRISKALEKKSPKFGNRLISKVFISLLLFIL
jgi:hypothetical protein